jgi:hypothetical protein
MVLEHAGKLLNKPGVITSVDSEEKYKVKMQHNSKEITVAGSDMKRMEPQKDKEVIVISGPDKGQLGQLYEIDGEDGIVRLPDDIKILDIWRICPCEDDGEHPTMAEREYDLASIGPGNSGLQLGSQHEIHIRENVPFDICFIAESVIESMNGRICPDRMDKVCAFIKPLGLRFTQVYGQAHVYGIIPGSQADRLMKFCPRLMLTTVAGKDVAAMEYDDIVTLVREAERPVILSFMHDRFDACPNFFDDSSSDEDVPPGPCHWHGCRKACMNKYSMACFTKAGYVFNQGNIHTTSDFTSNWGFTTARWPLDAAPAYKIIIGNYTFGRFKDHEHVI